MPADYKTQFNDVIDRYDETDPKCAYAAGMLHILSLLRVNDGMSSLQIAKMHTALREVGEERGWTVGKVN